MSIGLDRLTVPLFAGRPAEAASDHDGRTLIALEGISLSFGGITALSEVDLTLAPGVIQAVIGPNGAGKSSLINVISGLYRPDHGRIRLEGRTLDRVPPAALAGLGIARTFQNVALFSGLSVFDNVVIGAMAGGRAGRFSQLLGLPSARAREAAAREQARIVLGQLDLLSLAARPVDTLAYGLRKRVELARALAARPRLLLLDEPMAGMTTAEKAEMSGFIRDARIKQGIAVILIEHDIGVVMGLSDRITVLDHGRLIAEGTPDEIRRDQRVIDAYLGVDHGS